MCGLRLENSLGTLRHAALSVDGRIQLFGLLDTLRQIGDRTAHIEIVGNPFEN